jgi:hypothetical protein
MSVQLQIYSNANSYSTSVDVDFVGDVLVSSFGNAASSTIEYYFKTASYARTDIDGAMPIHIIKKLDDLALNPTSVNKKQSATDTANAYADINSMVIDYVYDYVHGHIADQYSSGCSAQNPMKFA